MEQRWDDNWQGKPRSSLTKTCPCAGFVQHKYHKDFPAIAIASAQW